ncbi:MAG TPA: carboxypeptidase regulatory-like domain-containing protein [Chloroflexota bacterium]
MSATARLRRPLRVTLAALILTSFILAGLLIDDAQAAPSPTPSPTATRTPTPSAPTAPARAGAEVPKPAPPPGPIKASEVLKSAQKYLGVPYVYGGFAPGGFDCSGYVSKIWEVSRHTTDNMAEVTRAIGKDELLPGDALNYPQAGAVGHIRIFDKWATTDKALVWVYEATEPQVMHRVVPFDPRYLPVRRLNIQSDVPMPPPPPLPADWNKPRPEGTRPALPQAAPKPPAYLIGQVVDEKSGQPLRNARVFFWTESEQYSVSSVVTDKDGRYQSPKLTAGTYELAAYANGYDVEFRGSLDLRTGGTAWFEVKLSPALGALAGSRIGPGQVTPVETSASRDLASPPATLPPDHDIASGHFFTQTAGRDGISGYAIGNEGGVRFWDEFQRLGGVQALGYPVSRRFQSQGFTVQAMQKGVLQWRPEVGRAWLTNVFDELSAAGKDDWLFSIRSTPRPLDPSFDGGRPWAQVMTGRLALLDPQPPIDRRYESAGDPLTFFGLPTSRVEDMGNHFAIRLQRAVIQLWKVDVPWAKAGETTVANGGDVAKEAGLFPPEATAPQRSPLLANKQ